MKEIIQLKTEAELKNLFLDSEGANEVLILKYSPVCTLSFTVLKILETWLNYRNKNNELVAAKVNVIEDRGLSNYIESLTGIKHESPQLIWYDKKGNIKWNGSHFRINETSLNANMNELTA